VNYKKRLFMLSKGKKRQKALIAPAKTKDQGEYKRSAYVSLN
jgi:hypothetical protein